MAKKNKNKTKSQTPDSSTNSSIKDPGIVKSKKKKISKFSNSEYKGPRLHHQRDFNSFSLLVFGNSFFYAPEACIKFSEHFFIFVRGHPQQKIWWLRSTYVPGYFL